MEEWEKKFAALEAEVDAEFESAAAAKKAEEKELAAKKKAAAKKRKEEEAEAAAEDEGSLIDDIKHKATEKALEKVAEKSLVSVNPRMAAVYGVGTILALWLVWTNLFKLLFIAGVVGSLYYFLVARKSDDDDEEELEEDDE